MNELKHLPAKIEAAGKSAPPKPYDAPTYHPSRFKHLSTLEHRSRPRSIAPNIVNKGLQWESGNPRKVASGKGGLIALIHIWMMPRARVIAMSWTPGVCENAPEKFRQEGADTSRMFLLEGEAIDLSQKNVRRNLMDLVRPGNPMMRKLSREDLQD
ncbi:hypothetical protein L6452_32283 [Arctium lappa]|uniref:Uncharacterized protein n=1 Tax=Arctium lappa TaxID=4217 RepID=A0ACB8Z396_ARCLA|nr:hypothetical protein L6452_32283 [Arctium lappa]